MKLSFEVWVERVNREVIRLTGFDRDFFPDWDYRKAYDGNVKPEIAAKRVIKAAESF